MTDKLLPCPFCGGPAMPDIEANGASCFWVICDNVTGNCGCEGPYAQSEEKAIEAWNRRTPDATLLSENLRYREALEKIATRADDNLPMYTPGSMVHTAEVALGRREGA